MDNMVGSCSEGTGEEDDELSDEEVALDVGKDEGALDLDDSEANDLDIGLDLPQVSDADDGANTNLDMDFADLFGKENDVTEAGDDDAGPREFDASIGVAEPAQEDLDDDALGIEDAEPGLEANATAWSSHEGDDEGTLETLDLFIADESEVAVSPDPWSCSELASGDFEVVSSNGACILAAGATTWFGRGNESRRLELGAVCSAALLGSATSPTVLVSTKLGELLEVAPDEQRPPRSIDWKSAVGLNPRSPATLALCRLDGSDTCLALSSDRLLVVSRAEAQPLEFPARPLAVPSSQARLVILAEVQGALYLLRASGPGEDWTSQPLPPQVNRVFGKSTVLLAVEDRVVALGNRQEGTFLSNDGGKSFRPVTGTAGSAALTAGSHRGAACIWVVVSHEVRGESDLLRVDPESGTAVRLARFETHDPNEDSFAPVTGLHYDATTETLYAVGSFGLLSLKPAPAE